MTTKSSIAVAAALGAYALTGVLVVTTHGVASDRGSWDPKAAAAYLDGRTAWWMAWAASDIGGVILNPPRPDFASPVRA